MVTFDDLRISSDKQSVVVECHVDQYDIYKDMYIKSIHIEYFRNRGVVGVPGEHAICIYENTEPDTTVQQIRKTLSVNSLSADKFGTDKFDGGLFYVTVQCDGNLPASAASYGCWADNTVDVGVILDWQVLYHQGMQYVAALTDACNVCDSMSDFEHFILVWNAIKLAIDTCDWVQLDKLWPDLVGGTVPVDGSGCGCKRL